MAVAAFLFNWQVLPRLGGRALWRESDHGAGYPIGILLYPLSVLALVLALREERWMVAAVWGLLAVGDGMASIVGLAVGGPRLPWNPRKGWAGFLAFVVCGGRGGRAPVRVDAGDAAARRRLPVDPHRGGPGDAAVRARGIRSPRRWTTT
jgi:CDP-diglyceride synthetase